WRTPAGRTRCSGRARTSARSSSSREVPRVRRQPLAEPGSAGREREAATGVRALVTGGEGGIGRAIRTRLEAEGYEVESLDVKSGFDVSDSGAWERVGAVELACLNAGVLTGESDPRKLTDEQYRRAIAVNVDGVVFGVR